MPIVTHPLLALVCCALILAVIFTDTDVQADDKLTEQALKKIEALEQRLNTVETENRNLRTELNQLSQKTKNSKAMNLEEISRNTLINSSSEIKSDNRLNKSALRSSRPSPGYYANLSNFSSANPNQFKGRNQIGARDDNYPDIQPPIVSNHEDDLPDKDILMQRWSGAYFGINGGFGFSPSSNASVNSYPISGTLYSDYFQRNPLNPIVQSPDYYAASLANFGKFKIPANGFLGGIQAGYNFLLNSTQIVIGAEIDLQGSNIEGKGSYRNNPITQSLVFSNTDRNYYSHNNSTYYGSGSSQASIDWLSTARGKLGYLLFPSLMIYSTGGAVFAKVAASSKNEYSAIDELKTINYRFNPAIIDNKSPGFSNSFGGEGSYQKVEYGWIVGGGFGWMMDNHWSLKGEALYYNLGAPEFKSNVSGIIGDHWAAGNSVPILRNSTQSINKFTLSGIIIRAGFDYHLQFYEH